MVSVVEAQVEGELSTNAWRIPTRMLIEFHEESQNKNGLQ